MNTLSYYIRTEYLLVPFRKKNYDLNRSSYNNGGVETSVKFAFQFGRYYQHRKNFLEPVSTAMLLLHCW